MPETIGQIRARATELCEEAEANGKSLTMKQLAHKMKLHVGTLWAIVLVSQKTYYTNRGG